MWTNKNLAAWILGNNPKSYYIKKWIYGERNSKSEVEKHTSAANNEKANVALKSLTASVKQTKDGDSYYVKINVRRKRI